MFQSITASSAQRNQGVPARSCSRSPIGETKRFGQKMAEIQITTVDGLEVGFGIAEVHRNDGDAVVEALR